MSRQENHKANLDRLKRFNSLARVVQDPYFKKHFFNKYAMDLPRACLELFSLDLTYQQRDIWEAYKKGGAWEGGMLLVPSGHGCHGIDTPIMRFNGDIAKVQDIKIGDKLMGDDGKTFREVLSLTRGQEELYEFHTVDGLKRIYNKSHILVLVSMYNKQAEVCVTVNEWLKWSNDEQQAHAFIKKSTSLSKKPNYLTVKEVRPVGKGDYYGFALDGNHKFLDGDCVVQHNTGKTLFIGVIATMHLLLFPDSITRIQAPTINQVSQLSFKEVINALQSMKKMHRIGVGGVLMGGKWGFLLDLIQINDRLIYAKGSKKSWYIEAKTAPRKDSTNLSGQHQLHYLLILDEASGIEDGHIEASLGGLSEVFNSCIMFSQHTRLSGKFHNFVTNKTVDKGGIWRLVRLSSRLSPRVALKQLKAWLDLYTDDEIRVRIDGLPPLLATGMLINPMDIERAYQNTNSIFQTAFKSIAFSIDIGYMGYRDSSVISAAEMKKVENLATNKEKTFYKLLDIIKYNGTDGKLPVDFMKTIAFPYILNFLDEQRQKGIFYDTVYVITDATAGGYEAYTTLEDLLLESQSHNFEVKGLQWGSERLYFEDKKRFINGRAKAYVNLKESLLEGRFQITTNSQADRTKGELSNIAFNYTDTFKCKILSKEELARKGIPSPDIADTLAQLQLIDTILEHDNSNIEQPRHGLERQAEDINDEFCGSLVELEDAIIDEVEDISEFENEFDDEFENEFDNEVSTIRL